MQVSIVSKGEMRLVGVEVVGRRSELAHRVPLAWLELQRRLGEVTGVAEPGVFVGACPERDHQQSGADCVYTYFAGVEADGAPAGLKALQIPTQRYAAATAEGTADAIPATYRGLAGWLVAHGLRADPEGFVLERYEARRQSVTPPYERFDFDIWKPIA